MKHFHFLLLSILLQLCVEAQENAIDKYFQGFQKKHNLDEVAISPKMFSIYLKNEDAEKKKELTEIIKNLTGLKSLSQHDTDEGETLFKEAVSLLPKEYVVLSNTKTKEKQVASYTKDNKEGKTTELVIIIYQSNYFKILSLTGNISLEDISKLSQQLKN